MARLEQLLQHLVQHLQLAADVHQIFVNPVRLIMYTVLVVSYQVLHLIPKKNIARDRGNLVNSGQVRERCDQIAQDRTDLKAKRQV